MIAELTGRVELRAATPGDHEFLFQVYASTRADELAATGWAPAQVEVFLRMQSGAQESDYLFRFPGSSWQVVLVDGVRAGRLFVDRSRAAIRLVDIALLPEFRGVGVGTFLINHVLAKAAAAGLPVELQVLAWSPVRHHYLTLGFVETGSDSVYIGMRWSRP
ncbi:MAG: GNAT family N-acetyltransferase [Chloroflexi bacterium]|nr:MAG: GNAT family N-acetyltransferase [Chloroflexota bacterium]